MLNRYTVYTTVYIIVYHKATIGRIDRAPNMTMRHNLAFAAEYRYSDVTREKPDATSDITTGVLYSCVFTLIKTFYFY